MRTVYVPQEPQVKVAEGWAPQFDLSPAIKFGSLQVLLPPGPLLLDTEQTILRLKEKLETFTDQDSILCIGNPSAISAAVMVASWINDGYVAILQYDRAQREYNRIILEM